MCPLAFSASVNRPVLSITNSTPSLPPRQCLRAFLDAEDLILWPFTTSTSSSATVGDDFSLVTVPLNWPCVRVVLEQVGEVVGRDEVVDGDDVEVLAEQPLLDEGPEDQPPDAPEPVDPDLDGHGPRAPVTVDEVVPRQGTARAGNDSAVVPFRFLTTVPSHRAHS